MHSIPPSTQNRSVTLTAVYVVYARAIQQFTAIIRSQATTPVYGHTLTICSQATTHARRCMGTIYYRVCRTYVAFTA